MKRKDLIREIEKKKSLLCVGLDTDINKIPEFLKSYEDPIYEFNKRIIDATSEYAVAYKPNIAFYEAHGVKGWESLQKTIEYCPKDVFLIADAKRGDIGNTSRMYARAFFEQLNFHSITVAPYMGEDSVKPFLVSQDKWVILLGLTSNAGSKDFQDLRVDGKGVKLYEEVLAKSQEWGTEDQLMYVVGATKAEKLKDIRRIVPNHFLLIPGVGAQGGNLEQVCKFGMNKDYGLLINSARGIIYASNGEDFDTVAAMAAKELQSEMKNYMELYH